MANTIQIKRGAGKPDSLIEGELAIDTDTGALYSLVGGVVAELNEPPEGVDLSNYIDSTTKNDVVEGSFQILWDDSADPTYPFNGRIGYSKNSDDPNSIEGAFLYAEGTRGTISIGRDGDVELHGPSEIQGIPDRNDERPWITGFSYVQAADFRDADGNSIVGAGGGSPVHIGDEPQDPSEGDQWLEIPADGDASMWVWDGEKWLQTPGSGGSGGESLWTDNGNGSISYDGNVAAGGNLDCANIYPTGVVGSAVYPATSATFSGDVTAGSLTTNNVDLNDPNGIDFKAQGNEYGSITHQANTGEMKFTSGYDGYGGFITFNCNGEDRVTIGADGNVGFGGQAAGWGAGQTTLEIIGTNPGNPTASGAISFKTQDATTGFSTIYCPAGTIEFWTGSFADNQRRLTIDADGRVDITGSLYVNGTPKIGYSELITTLTTLRQATMDETRDIRVSLRSAIDELVAGFEQEIATQEIEA